MHRSSPRLIDGSPALSIRGTQGSAPAGLDNNFHVLQWCVLGNLRQDRHRPAGARCHLRRVVQVRGTWAEAHCLGLECAVPGAADAPVPQIAAEPKAALSDCGTHRSAALLPEGRVSPGKRPRGSGRSVLFRTSRVATARTWPGGASMGVPSPRPKLSFVVKLVSDSTPGAARETW